MKGIQVSTDDGTAGELLEIGVRPVIVNVQINKFESFFFCYIIFFKAYLVRSG